MSSHVVIFSNLLHDRAPIGAIYVCLWIRYDDLNIGHQDISYYNDHQGDRPYCRLLYCTLPPRTVIEVKMARHHFGPLSEPPTPSHTCWHIPANHTYGHWYKIKCIPFLMKSPKFCTNRYWVCVKPYVWWASQSLAPGLWVTLQSLITPNHI